MIVLIILLYSCGKDVGRVVFVGDSIIYGMGVDRDETVPYYFSRYANIIVENHGQIGATSALMKSENIKSDMMVVICIGANDYFLQTDIKIFRKNVSTKLSEISKYPENVYLCSPFPHNVFDEEKVLGADEYDKTLRELSEEYNCMFINDIWGCAFGDKVFMHDRYHPNKFGNMYIAVKLFSSMKMRK